MVFGREVLSNLHGTDNPVLRKLFQGKPDSSSYEANRTSIPNLHFGSDLNDNAFEVLPLSVLLRVLRRLPC